MSLARQFFREMRPLFRMLEEPFGRSPAYLGSPRSRSLLEDPFFSHPSAVRPAIDVTEEGNHYIVEAELPGVKKENIQVRVGDGGQSLTIEGKIVNRRRGHAPEAPPAAAEPASTGAETAQPTEGTTAVTTAPPESREISSEREFVGSQTFTRTVWLPRRVDANHVSAKLNDGVLTVTIPKAEDPGSVQVEVQ
ncbi:HSP20-like chaperone [Phanerochaete sordida]|uniref:HSP20-like chaperone n=1 Tax=Phanerochaete sordida TaxID=48140 RepID=A0A9P3GKI8_9APHY|nr:HSP20-like chaperone [Phanerochaete sordida]